MERTNKSSDFQIIPHHFTSQGLRCDGDFYLPSNVNNPPVIIMAHGFGAERSLRLPAYASFFASHGLAVFLFDYRCFGTSEGEPRIWVSPKRHIQDWHAALEYVRSIPLINPAKIALWGTSYSGGHVLMTAVREQNISCVVAQVPFVDASSSMRRFGISFILKGFFHAIWDKLKSSFGGKPHFIKIVGLPSEFAALNTPDAYDGVMKLIEPNQPFINLTPARCLLELAFYAPIKKVSKIQCPTMIMGSGTDTLIDINAVKKTVSLIPNCEYIEYECGHFDIYLGNLFEDSIQKQLVFFEKYLSFDS
jgi:pimeloyl-ACP methyl ester carboxylesterase